MGSEDAQPDIGAQFTAEFNEACAKQSAKQEVMRDIIARIAAGEKAMIVFCEEEEVREFSAFNLTVQGEKLCIADYD